METVLVAGATGYMGRYLVSELHRRGYRVRVLVRSRERAEQSGEFGAPSLRGLVDEWVVADVGDASEIDGDLCHGVDRVVSALGVTRQRADPWDIDFRGNLRLLSLAEEAAVASFLYVNVMHVHEGTSMVMRSKAAFVEVLRRSAVTSQIVNPSGYFSDASEFVHMAHRGIAFELGAGAQRLNPIHGADLAEFCIDRLGRESGEWNVGGLMCTPFTRLWTWHLLRWANVLGQCASRCELFAPLCGRPIDWAAGLVVDQIFRRRSAT